jgi:HNH endonuclease
MVRVHAPEFESKPPPRGAFGFVERFSVRLPCEHMFVAAASTCPIRKCRRPITQGGFCSVHFEQRRIYGECTVRGCEKPISRPALGLCEMHFYRQYGHGSVHVETVRPARVFRRLDRGYVLLRIPGHPLANGDWVYEHRCVLYEQLGSGPQECWWCGIEVRWDNGLQVDHLDHDRSNNDPANLVPSCQACNMGRGAGCDPEGWAISMAIRRIVRRHADEFKREVRVLRARLEAVPYASEAKPRNPAQQVRYAARAAYEEVVKGRPRGRWQKGGPG